jgi:hypothetical protein
MLAIRENQHKNIVEKSVEYFDCLSIELDDKIAEIEEISSNIRSTRGVLSELKERAENEFNSKFVITNSGEIDRIKSPAELELDDMDQAIRDRENEIRDVVEEITNLEIICENKEKIYRENFSKLNNFFSRNGWNIMKDNGLFVWVYCCCYMLVFQRARNNASCLRFEDIVPVKLELNPIYAESHLINDESFIVPQDIISDVIPIKQQATSFLYEPQTFYNLMNVVTSEICKWTKLRERLYSLRRKLGHKSRSVVKVNVNHQIEIILVVDNSTLSASLVVPLTVRLMWFDPVGSVNYGNFSYIISDSVAMFFPNIRSEIDARIKESTTVWEPNSFELLESVVVGIRDVMQTSRGQLTSIRSG